MYEVYYRLIRVFLLGGALSFLVTKLYGVTMENHDCEKREKLRIYSGRGVTYVLIG